MTLVEKIEKCFDFVDYDDFGNFAVWEPFISDIILEDKEYPYIKECVDKLLEFANKNKEIVSDMETEDILKLIGII